MFHRYKSDFSNQAHQLIVSVSRHYYVTQEGKYRYQKIPFSVALKDLSSLSRTHIVHYIIRDHFSGLFYAELADSKSKYSIFEFLFRAWSKKAEHPFHGMPYGVSIPKNIQFEWPQIIDFLKAHHINPIEVTSGFQGGIRDVRTWEDYLKWVPYESEFPPDYAEVQSKAMKICRDLATWASNGKAKVQTWREHLKEAYLPESKEAFLQPLNPPQHSK